jgi:serine phosphatase RsbU (regulator of sigma subunit)
LLPRETTQPHGWRVVVHYSAGFCSGGDYYDVLPLADGRQLFLVADSSEQGAASTALALMVRVVVHSCPLSSGVARLPFCPFSAPSHQPPHILLGHLSRVLAENKLPEQYMTCFCGILDPSTGRFEFANAGHPYPLWWRASPGVVEALREKSGPPLGTDPCASYEPHAIFVERGDLLVLYNDSLTVVLNGGRRMTVQELVHGALCEAADQGGSAVKAALLSRLDEFLAHREYSDEITFIIIERDRESAVDAQLEEPAAYASLARRFLSRK